MKKLVLIVALLALAGSAFAVDAGLGGRLYMVSKSGTSIHLVSVELNTSWAVAGWSDHGLITDDNTLDASYRPTTLSPEIWTKGGSGYGEIVMGLYNSSPNAGVMDIVKIAPTAGGATISLMSDGRAGYTAAGLNTYKGYIAVPDRSGQFTGATDSLVFEKANTNRMYTLTDSTSDGDWADDDSDYTNASNNAQIATGSSDREIANGKYWVGDGYGSTGNWDMVWVFDTPTSVGRNFVSTVVAPISANPRFAVDEINGHDAVYMGNIHGLPSYIGKIFMAIDLNDDGDAMDAGEIIDVATETAFGTNMLDGIQDIELVVGPDGKKFLIYGHANGNNGGDEFTIFGLNANGIYDGNGWSTFWEKGVTGSQDGWGTVSMFNNFEFDAVTASAPIPEPGTLLLLGTGVLGAVGYIRRRRMA